MKEYSDYEILVRVFVMFDIDLLVKNHHLPDAGTNRASNPSGTYIFRVELLFFSI